MAADDFRRKHRLGIQPPGDFVALIKQFTGYDVAIVATKSHEHGNTYLDLPGFRAHIEGKPHVISGLGTRAAPPASTPAGLKLVFALLIAPESVRRTHDDIARLSTASKGTVTSISRTA